MVRKNDSGGYTGLAFLVGFCFGMSSCNSFHNSFNETPEYKNRVYKITAEYFNNVDRSLVLRDGDETLLTILDDAKSGNPLPRSLYVNPRLEVMLGGKITLGEESK